MSVKNMAYDILDWATFKKGIRKQINGFTVRFTPKWSRYYRDGYEQDTYVFLREFVKPGMEIIDIGAHIGLFSVVTSQLTGPKGKVFCYEPTPTTFKILQGTLQLNHCDNVTANQAAVSGEQGMATFYTSPQSNANSLVKNKPDNELEKYDVKLETIDSISTTNNLQPSLIKIDVEGAELDVLRGGAVTFQRHKPVLILGLHPAFLKQKGDSLETIWNLLQEYRYIVKKEDKNVAKEEFCNQDLIFDVHCFPS